MSPSSDTTRSDVRSQAIECLIPVVFSDWRSSQEENAAEVYDALLAAGFTILGPNELQRVDFYCPECNRMHDHCAQDESCGDAS